MKITVQLLFICCFFFNQSFGHGASHKHLLKNKTSLVNERDVMVKLTYKFSINGHVNWMKIKTVVPQEIKNRQHINELKFSIEPDSIYKLNGNTYALFNLHDISEDFKISMKARMTIYKIIPGNNESIDSNFSPYLKAEPFIESSDTSIIRIADSIRQKTDIETVMETFAYVKKTITYKITKGIGADSVLKSGEGKCMDFSDLFNAFLRANKIPAKSVYGMVVGCNCENPFHAWSEVYLKKQGWILFDPTSGQSDIYKEDKNYKMKIRNQYVVLSEGRNDTELKLYHAKYRYDAAPGTDVKIKFTFSIEAD